MGDGDSGGLTSFLNPQTEDGEPQTVTVNGTEYTLVQAANPVNWTKLGTAVVLSGLTTISLGIQGIVINWSEGVVSVIDGLTSFVGTLYPDVPAGNGVIGALFVPLLRWYKQGLWEGSLEQFGIWGLPIAVGFTLLVVFVVVSGLQRAAAKLTGGG